MIFNEIISSLFSIFSDDDLYDFRPENIWDNSLSEYSNESNSTNNDFRKYKKYKEGEIYIVEWKSNIIDQIVLMLFIDDMIDVAIDYCYLELQKEIEFYDDSEYSLITLVTFETEEGFRVEEKVLYSNHYKDLLKVNKLIYLDFVREEMIKLFDKYKIKNVELVKIKIF